MIQIPALFWTLPAVAPATLLGTSTLAGIWGTAAAAVNFSRRIRVTWTTAVPAAVAAFILSFLGASAVAKVVNVACNLAALLWFGFSGHLLWQADIVMAPFNVGGVSD